MRFRTVAVLAVLCAPRLLAEDPVPLPVPPTLHLNRITTPITVDGDLSDPGWKDATVIETFYEFQPGDNTVPPVKTIARVGIDDKYFYASFWCEEPETSKIRAPYVDRDGVTDQQDYVGILLDVDNARRSAVDFWISPNGIQTDSMLNESPFGEDTSPDWFWESAGRIGTKSWTAEVRIPLSSLRYPNKNPQDWALMVYRVWPREFNYQFYSVKMPRGSSCFLCWSATVQGIEGLPQGMHYVLAPYAAGFSEAVYPTVPAGSPLGSPDTVTKGQLGLDLKWLPDAGTVVDATINPDFSQVESDVVQIGVNERFALFYPEKRPFFLEQVDLLQTPIQAIYTRTITDPLWGGRLTSREGSTSYTVLVTDDRGGGTVVIPGPIFSGTAPQDFSSVVGIGRLRHDLGNSFVGATATARVIDGGAYNYVAGPDFQWRPNDADLVTGQYLYSFSRLPDRPDLYPAWNGQKISGFGLTANWAHSTYHWDWLAQYDDFSDGFRADDGFVPQVGYEPGNLGSRVSHLSDGILLASAVSHGRQLRDRPRRRSRFPPGVSGNLVPGGRRNWRAEFDYNFEAVRINGQELDYDRLVWTVTASPSGFLPASGCRATTAASRTSTTCASARAATCCVTALVRPTEHLGLDLRLERQWIDEHVGDSVRATSSRPTSRASRRSMSSTRRC